MSLSFLSTHVHENMGPTSYISIACKLNQSHLFKYLPALKIMVSLIYILKFSNYIFQILQFRCNTLQTFKIYYCI